MHVSQALYEAIREDDVPAAFRLLEGGADPNHRFYEPPLLEAARYGRLAIGRLLISYGASVTGPGSYGGTPLESAARAGHEPLVRLLLAHGADPRPAFEAACAGRLRWLVDQLLEDGPRLDVSPGPAHWAARHGLTDVARRCLDAGAPLDPPLLLEACRGDLLWLVEELLTRGVRFPAPEDGVTPLHLAAGSRWGGDVAQWLLGRGASPRATASGIHEGETPLHRAAGSGNVRAIEALAGRGAVVKAPLGTSWGKGRQAIHQAALGDAPGAVELLVRLGADPEARDAKGQTALELAVEQEKPSVLAPLLAVGGGVTDVAKVLRWAAHHDRPEAVRLLVTARGAGVTQPEPKTLRTPLHVAARRGAARAADALLGLGAAVDARDADGRTPLHLAGAHGRFDAAALLIAGGASVRASDGKRFSVFHAACAGGLTEQVEGWIGSRPRILNAVTRAGETPLLLALRNGSYETARVLLDHGAGVARRDRTGDSPLHHVGADAALAGRLVAAGAGEKGFDVDALDDEGQTPLTRALSRRRAAVVEALLRAGASLEATASGRRLLEQTLLEGRVELGRVLLAAPAGDGRPRAEVMGEDGCSALHEAARRGNAAMVDLLLSAGYRANRADRFGKTPLHDAAEAGSVDSVSSLLRRGAKAATATPYGLTALHLAAVQGHLEAVRVLVGSGAPFDAEVTKGGWKGRTPADLAGAAGHDAVVAALVAAGARPPVPGEVEALAPLPSDLKRAGRCPTCGERREIVLFWAVTHGNLSTPASDTEVESDTRCLVCGTTRHEVC